MKKLIITLSITVILIASAVVFYSCEKEEDVTSNDTKSILITASENDVAIFDREQYRWVSKELIYIHNKALQNNNNQNDFTEQLEISVCEIFRDHGIQYPFDNESITEGIIGYCWQINQLIKIPNVNDIKEEIDAILIKIAEDSSLLFKDKEILMIYGESFLAHVAIIEQMNDENDKKPRTDYNNLNGESRLERQLLSCLDYQLDIAFSGIISTICFIANAPVNFVAMIAICGEEIYDGLWNHVN
jgi:hypothetical protein